MKMLPLTPASLLLTTAILLPAGTGFGQGSAFTYQGRLDLNGTPANGRYEFQFGLYDSASAGTQQGVLQYPSPVVVSNGTFAVTLDFGSAAFTGAPRWLDVAVRTNGGGVYFGLSPRQEVTSSPHAITAARVAAGGLTAGSYPNAVAFSNASNQFSGNFSGNGATVTNLNATNLTSGTLADARLSANVPRLNTPNQFTADQAITTSAQTVLQLLGSNSSGTWFNLGNSSGGGHTWNLISSGAANGEGAGKLLLRDASSGVVMTLSTNGAVGVGSTAPLGRLEIQAGADNGGGSDRMAIALAYRNGGYRHWIRSRHNGGGAAGNSIDFFVNTNGASGASTGPGTNNTLVLTLDGAGDGSVGVGTSSPATKLDVNGSIRTRSGIVFPDGSVQTRAAAGSTAPITASGYPAASTVTTTLNGIPCMLDDPVKLSALVDTSGGLALDNLEHATVRVRRVRSAGASEWARAFSNFANTSWVDPTNYFVLTVTVAQSGGATASVSVTNLLIYRYSLAGSNGQLLEKADLISYQNLPMPVARAGSVPLGSPSADVPGLSVRVNGVTLAGTVVASLPMAAGYIENVTGGHTNNISSIGTISNSLTLRANLSSGSALLTWLADRTPSAVRSIDVQRDGITLFAANAALPTHYRLLLADDGLPIEELDVAYSGLTAP